MEHFISTLVILKPAYFISFDLSIWNGIQNYFDYYKRQRAAIVFLIFKLLGDTGGGGGGGGGGFNACFMLWSLIGWRSPTKKKDTHFPSFMSIVIIMRCRFAFVTHGGC